MRLPPLYHWSPSVGRVDISQFGLVPYSPAVSHGGYAYPYICLGFTPSIAWGLSGDMDWGSEIEEWDLWQINLAETDDVRIRSDFGPEIREIRVLNAIPGDRCWWVAQRTPPPAIEQPGINDVVAARKRNGPKKKS